MGVDDGSAYREPHPHAIDLRGVKSLENTLEMCGVNARPGITLRDKDCICLALIGADPQLSAPR